MTAVRRILPGREVCYARRSVGASTQEEVSMKTTVLSLGLVAFLAVALLVSPASAAEPIATGETNWDGISVRVMSVERRNNVLTVKWAVVNEGDSATDIGFGFTGNDVCYVLDEENGTKYYALTDKEGNAVASSHDWMPNSTAGFARTVAPGKSLSVWMKLAAPPAEVSEISLFLNETEPIEGLAITDR
jgi:hypothetical protein